MAQEIVADRVRIDGEIGHGGMGAVYRGVYLPTGQAVAVKALRPEAVQRDSTLLERFRREADALARLNHPNIARVLETIEHGDRHYIIMEYYPRGDLNGLMHSAAPLPIARILRLALEVADALTRAHYLDIIHRDIKPANVLIADDGSAKLTDFGVAHFGAEAAVTGVGVVVGTLSYLSPEAMDAAPVDARADIWSFGVMLFEMIAGRRPFDADNAVATALAILSQPTPDLEALRDDCPVALVDLVNRMLEKDRDARVSSVRLVGAELEQIIHGRTDRTDTAHFAPDGTALRSRFATPTPHTSLIRSNLPPQTTAFVGREQEIEVLLRLLGEPETRLVTLLAPGGMGKTRLALEVAARIVQASANHSTSRALRFPDGASFVELAPLDDASLIVPAVADAVGCSFQADGRSPTDQLLDFLSEKRMLLVLDNFEHILDGALLVGDLLRRAPKMRFIATSRVRLNLQEESLFRIEGLTFPEWDTPEDALEYAAVKLFMQGARRALPGFTLTADDLPFVSQICRLVEGMPLGLLLAAAWLDNLTLAEIAQEIRRGLDILATEARNVPERQRSMRAVFDYSWNLLQEDERLILMQLSVFRGGWTREAAQEVAGASLRHLTTLVSKSLVRRDAASGRYAMHELLRQYLEARLTSDAEAERDARVRHAAYFGAWLIARQASLNGAQAKAALNLIQADMENIIPAFQWTVAQGAFDDIETMQFALVLVAEMTGRFAEGARIFEDAVERLSRRLGGEAAESLTLWRMRLCLYMLAGQGGDRYMSTDPVLEALPLFRERGADRDVNLALNMLAYAAMLAGDYEAASSRAQEAVALLDRLDDPLLSAITLGNLSYLHFLSGDYGEAERIAVMDMRRADASGSEIQMARVRNMLGEIYHAMNQEEKAKALFEESYALSRALDNRAYLAYVATNLGNVLHRMGRYSESVTRYEESVKLHRDAGNRRGVAEASNMLAGAYLMLGEFRRAIPHHHQALEVFRGIGDVRGVANSLAMLSSAESSEGDYADAVAHAEECLRLRRQMGNPMDIADVLGHLSRALVFSGDFARAGAVLDEMRTLANSNERLRFPLSSIAAASAVPFYLLQGEFQQVLEATAPYLTALEQYGMTFVLAAMNYSVGRAHLGLGDVDSAVRAYRRSLRAGVESASLMWQAANLAELAVITYAESDPARAVSWVSLALAHGKMAEWTHRHVEALLESLRPRLPVGAFAASVERGQALDLRTVSEGVLQA